MPNLVKKLVTSDYTSSFREADGMLLVSLAGLTVAETEVLRAALDEGGSRFRMVKNSLAKLAFSECGLELGDDALVGSVAIAFGSTEATITAAKVLSGSTLRRAGKIVFRAAVIDGSPLSSGDAMALASVPDRDTLRAQIAGTIQGPMRALAVALAAVPSGMARVLQARIDQAGETSEEAGE